MAKASKPPADNTPSSETTALWESLWLFSLTTGLAFLLYGVTAAPGITWAGQSVNVPGLVCINCGRGTSDGGAADSPPDRNRSRMQKNWYFMPGPGVCA